MRKLNIILLATALPLIFASCSLNDVPLERMGPEVAFRDSLRVEMFVNELYRYTNGGENMTFNRFGGTGSYGGAIIDAVTDIAVYAPLTQSTNVNLFINGNVHSGNSGNPDACWAQSYQGIRKANIILKYIDNCTNISPARKNRFIGEAKLLKAYFFNDLVKRYGGMPIVDDLLSLEGEINIPRNSYEDCVNYMVGLCDEAAALLPTQYPSNDYGRVTRGAAYALKSYVLLFAASPLYNEKPINGATDVQSYGSYDKERWNRAAEAALQCIELRNPDMTPAHELYPDYQRLFFQRSGNKETLFVRLRTPWVNAARANCPVGYGGSSNAGRCNTNVSLELVNMFETKNGLLPENDPVYDPQKPHENRDDRFYANVIYNGMRLWKREVEFFQGGKDYRNTSGQGCFTGFTINKFIDPQMSLTEPVIGTDNLYHFLRFAEVLLIYAEAKNEYLGNDDSAVVIDNSIYEHLNQLRRRGNLPDLTSGSLTKKQMREYIQRERAVELCFEEQRFYDLRRWRLAEDVLNRPVHGVKITLEGEVPVYGAPEEIEKRSFPERLYFYPIPQTELDKNPNLVKNPGW